MSDLWQLCREIAELDRSLNEGVEGVLGVRNARVALLFNAAGAAQPKLTG